MKSFFKKQSKKSGVYQIRNLVNNKVYIGSTKQFKARKRYASSRTDQED